MQISELTVLIRWLRANLGGDGNLTRSRYFARWIFLGSLVGIIAGVGSIAFFWMLEASTGLFLGDVVGYIPPAPIGEGNHTESGMARAWILPAVVALGGLLSGLLVFLTAPEAEGHGTDAAIDSFHHSAGRVRARVIPIKAIASAITIGSGGSAGREGPAAQISAGIGALLGQALKLDSHERRILLATGIGAGIGAIFRAPLGGAVLAAEILYIHDLEIEALFPSLIASIVGYTIFGSWAGWEPIFGAQPDLAFTNPTQLVYYVVIGLLCGVFGLAYIKLFYKTTTLFQRMPLPVWLKPAIGGLLVGLLGLMIPGVIGTGYGWLQTGMTADIFTIPIWVILLLPLAKILATSLSVGSGGSGGIFGPGMVIGGLLGAGFWRVTQSALPSIPSSPAPFTIVAMMALFGGVAHAPLAVMLMVAEMTGNLSLLAPAMIAVGVAILVTGDHSIYQSQLPTRADSPAHRYESSFPLLNSLTVRDLTSHSLVTVADDTPVADAKRQCLEGGVADAAVVDDRRNLLGIVTLTALDHSLDGGEGSAIVSDVMEPATVVGSLDMSLDLVLEMLATQGTNWMPVVEGPEEHVIGAITIADIVSTYRTALGRTARRIRGITADTVLLEAGIEPGSHLAQHALHELALPPHTLLISIQRDGATVLPRGDTILEPGDRIMILTRPESERLVQQYIRPQMG